MISKLQYKWRELCSDNHAVTQWIQDSPLCLEIKQGNDTDANVHISNQAGEKSYQ